MRDAEADASPVTPAPAVRGAAARWSSGRALLALVTVWSIPGAVATLQVYRVGELGLGRAALWQLGSWWAWVPLTPLVVALVDRFPLERGRLLRNVPPHLIAALAFAVPHLFLSALAGRAAGVRHYQTTALGELVDQLFSLHVHLDVLTYLAVLGVATASTVQRRLQARELVAARLEARLAESELRALEMQLHPHFLFNTLNAIAVLVRKADGARALATLTALADFLRLTLSERGRSAVPLHREIELTRRYLELEETRLGDRLSSTVEASADALAAEVPTLVLQPLVENAVKHGVAARSEPGRVEVDVRRRGDRLHLVVSDDGVGLPAGFALDATHGIGLANVRSRLGQMYPGDHALTVADRAGGGVTVSIEIPFRTRER